jgi:integrase
MEDGMARGIKRLSGADLRRSRPGLYADGDGLWLQVTIAADGKRRNRSWIFRYTTAGRTREMGLGSCNTLALSEARERARRCRVLRLDGIDPIGQRDAERAAKAAASARAISFEECAGAYIAAHRNSWRSEKHAQQWPQSLRKHVFPVFGKLPVGTVDTPLVMKALQPMWHDAPETGSRLRGRIEAILDWAAVSGHRPSDSPNPARWSGHLEHLLAAPRKLRPVEHLAAMPWREVPAFMAQLRGVDTVAARAFEFLILTSSRRGETIGAHWSEIDLDEKVWTVPGHRMKGGKEHRVPLPPRCIAILQEMRATNQGGVIFPGRDGPLAQSSFAYLLKTLGHRAVTAHGFRSAFRDWAGECTNFPREVCEAALAHVTGKVERAYHRSTALEKRRKLMATWAAFCAKPAAAGGDVVVPMRRVP